MARRLGTASSREVLVIDTPGLVRHSTAARWCVPDDTFAERRDADLVLHVIDASHPDAERRARGVTAALQQSGPCPVVPVWSHADRVTGRRSAAAEWAVSGLTGAGCDRLRDYLRVAWRAHH
jgi:GTP-binding protein HflX